MNPEISSGLPLPLKNRYPPPASRPELYEMPATKASDVAFNPVRVDESGRNMDRRDRAVSDWSRAICGA